MTNARLRLSFYGDDFTGSTDVMEALARAGLRVILFLRPPAPADLEAFPGVEVVGVAGMSRTLPPADMEAELVPAFTALRALDAQIFLYKICSTFDSSPTVGSIGKAIDIGQEIFASPIVPMVVGTPRLRRYVVFGNLFAGFGGEVHRLDRHPTMSRHPVTPMDESDVRLHLGKQTGRKIGLIDLLQLTGSAAEIDDRLRALLADQRPEIVLFDVLDDERLAEVGRIIWTCAKKTERTLFSASASGFGYALVSHWQRSGELPTAPRRLPAPGPVDQILAVSGSSSPQTEGQIATALASGFVGIDADAPRLVDPETAPAARAALVDKVTAALETGRSVLLYSARGPGDGRIRELQQLSVRRHGDALALGRVLGSALGQVLRSAVERRRVPRVVSAGGDTSGHLARALGIDALETIAETAPGAPLCRATSRDPVVDGLEIVMKGGQMGTEQFFVSVKTGQF